MDAGQIDESRARKAGAVVSLLLHGVLIAIITSHFQHATRGDPVPSRPKSIQISISTAPPSPVAAKPMPVVPPVPPSTVPPKPIEPPRTLARLPAPMPVKPPPLRKPLPPSPAAASSTVPPGESRQASKSAPPPPVETPEQSLLGSIRDNWLEPASMPRNFRCRIQIDYLAGGRISAIKFMDRCGEGELVESVRKAIWKTQPLPLPASRTANGNIEIEFAQ